MYEKHAMKKLHVQMFFLVMDTLCSKNAEDTENGIKKLIRKVCIYITLWYHRG